MEQVRIIIAGSRDFTDYEILKKSVFGIFKNRNISKNSVEIISGTARGADKLGEEYANEFGLRLKRFPADWSLGKRAGYLRNAEMAAYASGATGILIAFWDGESKGTKHMIDLAQARGLEMHVFDFSGKECKL